MGEGVLPAGVRRGDEDPGRAFPSSRINGALASRADQAHGSRGCHLVLIRRHLRWVRGRGGRCWRRVRARCRQLTR